MITVAVLAAALLLPPGPTYPVPHDQQKYVKCVAQRESNNNPRSTNSRGGYRGMFQFSEALADGSTWMLIPWLATWHDQPKQFAKQLRATPMNRWPRNLQVAAMVTVLNARGKWSGSHHWAGGRWTCKPGKAQRKVEEGSRT